MCPLERYALVKFSAHLRLREIPNWSVHHWKTLHERHTSQFLRHPIRDPRYRFCGILSPMIWLNMRWTAIWGLGYRCRLEARRTCVLNWKRHIYRCSSRLHLLISSRRRCFLFLFLLCVAVTNYMEHAKLALTLLKAIEAYRWPIKERVPSVSSFLYFRMQIVVYLRLSDAYPLTFH